LFRFERQSQWKLFFHYCDRATIYVFIASSYTVRHLIQTRLLEEPRLNISLVFFKQAMVISAANKPRLGRIYASHRVDWCSDGCFIPNSLSRKVRPSASPSLLSLSPKDVRRVCFSRYKFIETLFYIAVAVCPSLVVVNMVSLWSSIKCRCT
jgi:hypothetical protein